MTFAIVTAIHGRERLTREVCAYYEAVHDGPLVAVASGVDEGGWGRWDMHYTEKNVPSDKFNVAIQIARGMDVGGVCVVGSDDYLCPRYLKRVADGCDGTDRVLIGKGCYLYNEPTGETLWLPLLAGSGRLLTSNVLDKLNWKPYKDGMMHGVDGSMNRRLRATKVVPHIVDTRAEGLRIVGVKSYDEDGEPENINPFWKFRRVKGRREAHDVLYEIKQEVFG